MPYNGRCGHRLLLVLDAALSLSPSTTVCTWTSARQELYDYVFLEMPVFPTELTDEIIAWIPVVEVWVPNRYRMLLSCSLVCSTWLPASRHYLFQTLYIDAPERYDLLVSRVLHSEKMRIHLLSVRSVLLSADDTLHALIRRPFVLKFAGHLPNVTQMTFYGGAEVFLSHPTSGVAISRFTLVQSLSILDCTFPSFGAFRRTITSLPSLKKLMLDRPSWPGPAADLSPHLWHGASTVRPPALSVLYVGFGTDPSSDRRPAQQFVTWLSETATSSSLLELKVDNWGHVEIGCMETFGPSLLCFGPGLRKLDINVGESRDPGSELKQFFRTLTSLKVLRLRFDCAIQPDTWVKIETLVHSLPRPAQLVEFHIYVGLASIPLELSKFDGIEVLDEALQLELFQGLRAVKLYVKYRKEVADRREGPALTEFRLAALENKLPGLYARTFMEVTERGY